MLGPPLGMLFYYPIHDLEVRSAVLSVSVKPPIMMLFQVSSRSHVGLKWPLTVSPCGALLKDNFNTTIPHVRATGIQDIG